MSWRGEKEWGSGITPQFDINAALAKNELAGTDTMYPHVSAEQIDENPSIHQEIVEAYTAPTVILDGEPTVVPLEASGGTPFDTGTELKGHGFETQAAKLERETTEELRALGRTSFTGVELTGTPEGPLGDLGTNRSGLGNSGFDPTRA